MNTISSFMGGTREFLTTLFQRSNRVKGRSANGHVVMDGWSGTPEEDDLKNYQTELERAQRAARVVLYGIDGIHAGETFPLANPVELIGREADCSVVLTPSDRNQNQRVRVFINGVVRMLAETGSVFKVNGCETEHAELFDYDEVECMGNRFLVLITPVADGRARS